MLVLALLQWRLRFKQLRSVAIPVVVLAAVLILRIKGNGKIKGDAAIALISTTSLALGVMVISMTTGMNTDVYNYMFGSILAMSAEDVRLEVLFWRESFSFCIFFFIIKYLRSHSMKHLREQQE